jgi:hypothetical protein
MFKTLDHLQKSELLVLPTDLEIAVSTWSNWRDVLEFFGPPGRNPLLTDAQCFKRFLRAFQLSRSIRGGASEDFRQFLNSPAFPLQTFLADITGKSLDVQDEVLHCQFGTMTPGSRLKAPLSKIAWALKPAIFTPYDSQSRRGMEHIAGERRFDRYSDYLGAFNHLVAALGNIDFGMPSPALNRTVLSAALARIGRRRRYT